MAFSYRFCLCGAPSSYLDRYAYILRRVNNYGGRCRRRRGLPGNWASGVWSSKKLDTSKTRFRFLPCDASLLSVVHPYFNRTLYTWQGQGDDRTETLKSG